MERLAVNGGRYIPPASAATDADRLRALEAFIMQYSEATECALDAMDGSITELKATLQAWREGAGPLAKEIEQ